MLTIPEELQRAITTYRAAGQEYNIASTRCPICGLTFAAHSPTTLTVNNAPLIVAHQQTVTIELGAHITAAHVGPGRRWAADP